LNVGAASVPRFASWENFLASYANVKGTAVCYRRNGNRWKIDPGAVETWKVSKWSDWFESAHKQDSLPMVAYYLTDIPLRDDDLTMWRSASVEIDALSACGTLDLMRYIRLWNSDAPLPPMKPKGYLAPPWHIGTYPHFDGFGSQLSVHTYAFGPGYQLVHIYPELSAFQEELFREVCGLPARNKPQVLPHSFAFEMDDDANCWDIERQLRLAEMGIVPHTVHLSAGNTIILPPGRAHAFKKCIGMGGLADWRANGPMFSIAGDQSYVGPTAQSFTREFSRLRHYERLASVHSVGAYSLRELALLRLVCDGPFLVAGGDQIAAQHLLAAKPFFQDFVKCQEGWLDRFPQAQELDDDVDADVKEWACCVCRRSLANVVLCFVSKGVVSDECYCGDCVVNVDSDGRAIESFVRFFGGRELREKLCELK
jgi:hypothetical protein